MANGTVVGSTPTSSRSEDGLANTPAAATVGTHPAKAHDIALEATYRIEAMAEVLRREIEHVERGYAFALERLIRDIHKLNSVVMTVLGEDKIAPLADLAEIVGVEVSHG